MVFDGFERGLGEWREVVGDARVGDGDVDVDDVIIFEEGGEVGAGCFVLGVVGSDEELASGAFG